MHESLYLVDDCVDVVQKMLGATASFANVAFGASVVDLASRFFIRRSLRLYVTRCIWVNGLSIINARMTAHSVPLFPFVRSNLNYPRARTPIRFLFASLKLGSGFTPWAV